jgi:putative endonuclease
MAHHNLSDINQTSVTIGQLAELDAQQFLEKQGLIFKAKNYRVKCGEIDLIMQHDNYLVFIEVKMRCNLDYGNTLEMVSKSKQTKVIQAAKHYLVKHHLYDSAFCRFDVIGISPKKNNPSKQEITWIKNAFEVQY